jgi:hypothetical protein
MTPANALASAARCSFWLVCHQCQKSTPSPAKPSSTTSVMARNGIA